MATYNASITIMTQIKGYDNWKLDIPDPLEETRPYEQTVPASRGIFAWQNFCLRESQGDVPDWAWETCRIGPFTTLASKFAFRWHFLMAVLAGEKMPIHRAGRICIGQVCPEYFDACSEVEDTWRFRFDSFSLMAIQEQDQSINLYTCNFSAPEDFQ